MTSGIPRSPAARWVIALCAVGCALRLTGLDIHSLWFDEAGTIHCACADDFVGTLRQDRHPPLSFLAFRLWIGWFGQADATLRLLPALSSCLSLLTFVRLSRRLVRGETAQLVAVALYALSPFLVWYGQEVRMYAFVELGSVVALLAATAWLDDGARPARVAGLVLGVAVATGSHYIGALAAVVVCATALASPGAPRRRALVGLTACAGVAVWLPWFVAVIPDQLRAPWGGATTRTGLAALAELPARMFLTELWRLPRAVQVVALAPAAVLLGATALQVVRVVAMRAAPTDRRALAALVAPLVVAFGLGLIWPIDFLPRYLIAVTPPLVAVVAAGLAAVPGRWARAALLAVVFGGAALLFVMHRRGNLREDYRSACAEVAAAWQPGDTVVMVTGTSPGFSEAGLRHYLRERPRVLASIVPLDDALAHLGELCADGRRLHVVYRAAPYADPLLDRVDAKLERAYAGEERSRIRYLRFVALR